MARSECPDTSGATSGEQRVEAGGQVDVHVGQHGRVAGGPGRAQGQAPALAVEVDEAHAARRSASSAPIAAVASVEALSAMVIRQVNGNWVAR